MGFILYSLPLFKRKHFVIILTFSHLTRFNLYICSSRFVNVLSNTIGNTFWY
jgi:hypothetical protein